ncbi:hypothetical protein Btru_067579 [Bulinus truncatus]|nr:hypothetical protein Btru_067579 [Bulinus truncatus]
MEKVKFLFTSLMVIMIQSKVESTVEINALFVATSQEKSQTFCIHYLSSNQILPTSPEDATPHQLVDWSHSNGCKLEDFRMKATKVRFENNTVALSSGECSLFQKAKNVQIIKGRNALIVNNYPFTNQSDDSSEYQPINISLAIISYHDYQQVLLNQEPISVKLFAPTMSLWDLNMIIICLFSTIFVMSGAGWSALTEFYSCKTANNFSHLPKHDESSHDLQNVCKDADVQESDDFPKHQPVVITAEDTPESHVSKDMLIPKQEESSQALDTKKQNTNSVNICTAVVWAVVICSLVLLLYFFFHIMVYVCIAWFVIYGSYSMYQCLLPVWSRIMPTLYEISVDRPACCKTKIQVRNVLLYLPCLAFGIFWAIQRHSTYAWALLDTIGACLCIFAVKSIRFDSFKLLSALLICFLIYDIFMVFITPFFTKDGDSVMMKIATGGSNDREQMEATETNRPKEFIPWLFVIPSLSTDTFMACMRRTFSMLGFGDIVIPGILISYNAVLDVRSNTKMVYYLTSSLSYLLGMVICMISLVYMNSGQPALLYLIPCTLITTLVTALVRGELRKLVAGSNVQP